ncbi:hypothetical protein Tco_0817248 [Tanacetum coccineum]
MKMEQYLQCIDYTLWEIIENGNAHIVTKTIDGKETVIPPTSVEEKAQRRAEYPSRDINQKFLERSLSQNGRKSIYYCVGGKNRGIETFEIGMNSLNIIKAYELEVKEISSSTKKLHNVAILSLAA